MNPIKIELYCHKCTETFLANWVTGQPSADCPKCKTTILVGKIVTLYVEQAAKCENEEIHFDSVPNFNYIEEAVKTSNAKTDLLKRIDSEGKMKIFHGLLGISKESGEHLDQFYRHIFYGTELDIVNLLEELGDIFWFCAEMIAGVNLMLGTNYTFEDIQHMNIAKLRQRYGEKFSEDKAIHRNTKLEMAALEKVKEGKENGSST